MMTDGRFDLAGWVLFAVSGVVFLIAALRDGNTLLARGCVTWLAGVAAFPTGYVDTGNKPKPARLEPTMLGTRIEHV